MEKSVFFIGTLQENRSSGSELSFWLAKNPEERLAAVDFLRKQYYGREMLSVRKVAAFKKR